MSQPTPPKSPSIILSERQTAQGLLTHAQEFHWAAKLIADCVGTGFNGGLNDTAYHHPFYFLCGHSIELSMKAALLTAGLPHKHLKKIGHQLDECLAGMRSHHSSYSATYDEHQAIVDLLNTAYAAKEFEYRITGYRSWPQVDPLLYVVEDFYRIAEKIIKAGATNAAPDTSRHGHRPA